MNNRDELAAVIHRRICEESLSECIEDEGRCVKAADAILAAGYSRPRTVSTVAELDALIAESVVRCAAGMVFEKYPDDEGPEFDFWLMVGESRAKPSSRIALPASVLYEPEGK